MLKIAALSAALTVARPGAALPDRATRDQAANRLTGDSTVQILLLAQPFPQRHDLGSVIYITRRGI